MYQDKIKRYVLQEFKKGYKDNLSKNEIVEKLKNINGTDKEKEQLFMDCMIYIFLKEMFESNIENREKAINLAIRYIKKNHLPGNLVKEKLLDFYKETGRIEEAKELVEKLLIEDPNNRWVISKKIMLLRLEGKDEEALQFIKDREEIRKYPIVFNLEYRILLKQRRLKECVQLLSNYVLDIEELGYTEEDRKRLVEQLYRYKGQLLTFDDKSLENFEIKKANDNINKRIKIEKRAITDIKKTQGIEPIKKEKINTDIEFVRKINKKIAEGKEILEINQVMDITEKIDNLIIKNIMKWQIEHAYGKNSLDIAKEVKQFSIETENFTEIERKVIRVLQNFLTSKSSKFYKHNNWTDFQKIYFQQLLYSKKQNKNAEFKERNS